MQSNSFPDWERKLAQVTDHCPGQVKRLYRKTSPCLAIIMETEVSLLFYGLRGNFSCGTQRLVPSGQDTSILPARVANHSAGFDSDSRDFMR